jgi:hypothetical protein
MKALKNRITRCLLSLKGGFRKWLKALEGKLWDLLGTP